ncbi:hypothetical protein ACJX0J_021595, partial [Zea mays]
MKDYLPGKIIIVYNDLREITLILTKYGKPFAFSTLSANEFIKVYVAGVAYKYTINLIIGKGDDWSYLIQFFWQGGSSKKRYSLIIQAIALWSNNRYVMAIIKL